MINVTVFRNQQADYIGFKFAGHAGYADPGYDIVCAGVSAIVINTINSIEEFTDVKFSVGLDEKSGLIDFKLEEPVTEQTQLLIKSLILGIEGIKKDYNGDYITLKFKEV